MAIKFLSNQTINSTLTTTGAITSGGNLRVSSGVLYVGNGATTTARIMGYGDYEMITGVSGATYLRVSGSSTLAGTLQGGQYILASGLAYGAVNSYTQIIDGSTGAITGTTASFNAGTTNVVATFTSTDGIAGIKLEDSSGNVELSASGNNFQVQPAGGTAVLTIDGSNGIATFTATTKSTRFTSTTTTALHWSNYTGTNGWQIGSDSTAGGMYIYNENAVYCLKLTDAGNATFAGSVTATQFNGSVVITGGTASFVSTVAGATVVSSEGAYAANGNVKLYEAKRSGGAVGGDWSYNDATTDMSLGTNTNHDFNLKTDNTTAITISNSQEIGINNTSPTSKLTVNGNSNGSAEFSVTLGTPNGATGAAGSGSTSPVNKTLLTGYGIPYSGQTNARLTTCGFLEFASTAGWTGSQRTWAITSGYDIGGQDSGAGGNKMAIILGNAQNVSPQIGTNGAIGESGDGDGANSLVACYWDNALNMRLAGSSRLYTGGGGSAAFPMITPGTDKNTGIWYPTSDTWAISTAGEERMRINSSGNVGIGDASPTSISANTFSLSVNSSRNDLSGAFISKANGTVKHQQYWDSSGYSFNLSAGNFQFNGGNVGIGTTTPNYKLSVANASTRIISATYIDGTNGIMSHAGAPNYGLESFQVRGDSISFWTDYDASHYQGTEKMRILANGNVGIGVTQPNYNLEIGGSSNPKIAIVSNINSATSSLYFGDSDATDRGQIAYTHFGDFMEIKTGGATRLYLESGINTAYTPDGLFNANATPSYWNHGQAQFKLGYMDNGSGLYSGAYCFNVKSTDGIPVTGREIGAVYIRDTSNNRMPLIISNQGRININQTNTSYAFGSSTGWLTIANGTGAYNIYNYYTGTDGGSGCARYRLDNTSPSFFDFYYSTTQVGYITTNGTDIFYANTSDYRLKEDLKSFDGMSLLEQIQVYDFKWKESDNRMYGVVAHELQEVIPQAVVGEKDKEKLQAVDYSKLVPVLIKSIQELEARVKELENN